MARRCAAMLWLGQTGIVSNIFTSATTHPGEDETKAREGREGLCRASHGELQLRRVAVAAGTQLGHYLGLSGSTVRWSS